MRGTWRAIPKCNSPQLPSHPRKNFCMTGFAPVICKDWKGGPPLWCQQDLPPFLARQVFLTEDGSKNKAPIAGVASGEAHITLQIDAHLKRRRDTAKRQRRVKRKQQNTNECPACSAAGQFECRCAKAPDPQGLS